MAADGLIASETMCAGIRAEVDSFKISAELASGNSIFFPYDYTELLSKDELRHQRIHEEVNHRIFPEVSSASPASQFRKQIPIKADRRGTSWSRALSLAPSKRSAGHGSSNLRLHRTQRT
jgi:hypothetical protein